MQFDHLKGRNWPRLPHVMIVASVCLGLSAPSVAKEGFDVGVAVRDITPPVGHRKAGSYREVVSTGVRDPLLAKAMVFRQGGQSAAIVLCDLLSVPRELSQAARLRASEQTGIPVANMVIAATHNHGSPEYWGSLRDIYHQREVERTGSDQRESIDYRSLLIDQCSAAIVEAFRHASPSQLSFADARQTGLAFNRRFHMRDGSVQFNPGRLNPKIVRAAGPVDEDLPVLFVHDSHASVRLRACLSAFSLHTAVRSGTEFSADFPAVIQSAMQKTYGTSFVSLFAEAAAGDINHIDVTKEQSGPKDQVSNLIGETLADAISKAHRSATEIEKPSLAVASSTIEVPFQPVDESGYRRAASVIRNQQSDRTPFLDVVAAWRDCHRYHHARQYGDAKPIEIQAIRLNREIAIVTLPHELFVEIGLSIKANSPFAHTIVISLANDVDYYIPTRRAFGEGSYEVTTCPLEPGCGELMIEAAVETLRSAKSAEHPSPN